MKFKFTALAAIYAAAVLDGERAFPADIPTIIQPQVGQILGLSDASADASGSSQAPAADSSAPESSAAAE